jgi:glycosyltransferase 2 family protein
VSTIIRSKHWRLLLPVPLLVLAGVLVWLRGPNWHQVGQSFGNVRWYWVVVAVALNLLSVVLRSAAWNTVIHQAMPPPRPAFRYVFAAFCVGLLANVVLPGRVGELARVAVLARRTEDPRRAWPILVGSVVAHRMFDLFPSITLVVWVVFAAKLPTWALTSLKAVLGVSLILMFVVWMLARRRNPTAMDEMSRMRRIVDRGRQGLAIMRKPIPALIAALFQYGGWFCQLFAVWAAMFAFNIHEPLAAAGLVLVLMNVAGIFPLWPGNVGLVQAAIAIPLKQYGIDISRGLAFGFGLQAIEASVGVGIGLVFLAREGLSFATLKEMPRGEGALTQAPAEPTPRPSAPATARDR